MKRMILHVRKDGHNNRRMGGQGGFTLTELGLVMGVVSLVLGGIWGAVGGIERQRINNKVTEELSIITSNMRALYQDRNIRALPTTAAGGLAGFTTTLLGQGVFPAGMNDAGTARSPWLGQVLAGIVAATGGAPLTKFIVEYRNVPLDYCVSLLVRNSTPGRETGLARIELYRNAGALLATYDNAALALPILPAAAAAQCTAANAPFRVRWYYTFNLSCEIGVAC